MYVTNITDGFDYFTDLCFTNNCTIKEINTDIIIQSLILSIPCGPSFLCLVSLMVYTLIKPLINNK